jgi:hypothetical protein
MGETKDISVEVEANLDQQFLAHAAAKVLS